MNSVKAIRIGCGAGYSGDRIDPAVELAESGRLDYLVFECLAERTIALAQQSKARDPEGGYDPLLAERLRAVLPACRRQHVRIVTNMGAANPAAASRAACEVAAQLQLHGLKIASVTGDDVLDRIGPGTDGIDVRAGDGRPLDARRCRFVSANAYIGSEAIVQALADGADIVITGRAADPSLFLAPQMHEFGWSPDDWPRLGAGTLNAHLLECAGQVTGGYFADPGVKDVEGLDRLGFPIAEVVEDGSSVLTKVPGSGGKVTVETCKEQLLYEVGDPSSYLTPDVAADFSAVSFVPDGDDRVRASGASGRPRPGNLKVSVGYLDGYIGEGQMSYGGPGAEARARLALEVVGRRLERTGFARDALRLDVIGINSLYGQGESGPINEVRIRVAGRAATRAGAARIGDEVETLYTNGPAGGGGAFKSVREVLAVGTAFIPRDLVTTRIAYQVV